MTIEKKPSNSFPSTWRLRPLSEFNAQRPGTINPASYSDETFEYYSIPAYQEGQRPTLTRGSEIGSSKLLLDVGTVLFGKLNPRVEKVWRIGNHTSNRKIGSTEWLPLVPRDDVDEQFLYFLMWSEHVMPKAKTLVSGSTPSRQRVDPRSFYLMEAPLPPLPEQRKIAAVLGVVQRAIEQQERLIALTTELKKSLMHKLFTEGLRGERQKQTEIGPVPESWRVSRLDDFCVLQRGFDVTKTEQIAGNVPVVSSGGIASYHNVAKVKGPGVVVGRKGTLGKVHYLEVDYWPHDTTLWVKDFKENDPLFTSYFLKTLKFERFNSGASNPTLNRNTIHAELVAYPRKDEQAEIGCMLTTVDDKSRVHERKQTILKDLFRTLLHQLMTAQIRVHDLDLSFLEQDAVAS